VAASFEEMQRSLPRKAAEQINKFSSLIAHVEKIADFVRKTTSYIRPDALDHLGLIPALEWYRVSAVGKRLAEEC
jgi:hypothetical protein